MKQTHHTDMSHARTPFPSPGEVSREIRELKDELAELRAGYDAIRGQLESFDNRLYVLKLQMEQDDGPDHPNVHSLKSARSWLRGTIEAIADGLSDTKDPKKGW